MPSRIRIPVSVCPSFFPACREGVWMIPVCEGVWMIPVAFSLLRSSTLSLSRPLAPFLSPSLASSLPSPSVFFWTVMRGTLQHSAGASRVPSDKGAWHPWGRPLRLTHTPVPVGVVRTGRAQAFCGG